MSRDWRKLDFFTVTQEWPVGKTASGYTITALQLKDRKGAPHAVYHVTIGLVTEIFYDLLEAAAF